VLAAFGAAVFRFFRLFGVFRFAGRGSAQAAFVAAFVAAVFRYHH
jgi:hypothetical protein